jgi:hypothetical protein
MSLRGSEQPEVAGRDALGDVLAEADLDNGLADFSISAIHERGLIDQADVIPLPAVRPHPPRLHHKNHGTHQALE